VTEEYILSAAEKRALKDEQSEMEHAIREAESGVGAGTKRNVDVDYLRKKAAQIGAAVERGTPKNLEGSVKDKMARESKELSEQIREGMPSMDEMRRPEKHPGAIEKHMHWEKRNYDKIMRLKQINRQLNPDDPTSGNIERLRRER